MKAIKIILLIACTYLVGCEEQLEQALTERLNGEMIYLVEDRGDDLVMVNCLINDCPTVRDKGVFYRLTIVESRLMIEVIYEDLKGKHPFNFQIEREPEDMEVSSGLVISLDFQDITGYFTIDGTEAFTDIGLMNRRLL